jgi:hypothetical protein
MIWAWTGTSRADIGSSQTRNLGFKARARAIALILCLCPPLSSWGNLFFSEMCDAHPVLSSSFDLFVVFPPHGIACGMSMGSAMMS